MVLALVKTLYFFEDTKTKKLNQIDCILMALISEYYLNTKCYRKYIFHPNTFHKDN